ncbi:MAG: M3 family metallopeptidase [Deltaproteobacteria bacterium]|jgi:oligoendopeptidase F|nr:M3 family metallopeptidase [Deltaproteobacteria bacterium]
MKENNQKLPRWDLSRLYKSVSDPKIKEDLATYKKLTTNFAAKYKGKIAKLNAKEMFEMFELLERLEKICIKLWRFFYLKETENYKNIKVGSAKIHAQLQNIESNILFYKNEIVAIPENKLCSLLKNKKLREYLPALKYLRRHRAHKVSDVIKNILSKKDETSFTGWLRLYNQSFAKLRFRIGNKEYSNPELWALFNKVNGKKRKEINNERQRVYADNADFFAYLYNMIIRDQKIEANIYKFDSILAKVNFDNQVDDKTVELLLQTVNDSYKNISQRFFKLKARLLGVSKIPYWDAHLQLDLIQPKRYNWNEAKVIILSAYKEFSPELYKIVKNFFDNRVIDAEVRAGKRDTAFACPVPTIWGAYLSLQFTGTRSNVAVLAHELGHASHFTFLKQQKILNNNSSIFLCEVPSTFGAFLTLRKLLDFVKSDLEKLEILMSQIQQMINDSLYTALFHNFEIRAHQEINKGMISAEHLAQIFQEERSKYFGSTVNLMDKPNHEWLSFPTCFFHPCYCYSYSFASGIVQSLYKVYQEKLVPDFEEKYLKLLSESGVKDYQELLKPFGLDVNQKDFWQKGLNLISDYLDEAEELSQVVVLS